MRRTCLRSSAGLSAAALACALAVSAATRPRYGGTLRVEMREAADSPEPPRDGHIGELAGAFKSTRWEPGRRAAFAADDDAPGGRPFLDTVEIEMGKPPREQSLALELGKADLVEGQVADGKRARRRVASAPVRILLLQFSARIQDPKAREAFALSIDRAAIHQGLLQRQGEVAGSLLPQWLSGYAFLFPASRDLERARALLAGLPSAARTLSLFARPNDPQARAIVDRVALNARDAGFVTAISSLQATADVKLVEARVESLDPGRALAGLAAQLGLPEPPKGSAPEILFPAERALLDGGGIVPLVHLPEIWSAGPRVRWWNGQGLGKLGEWRLEDAWLESRP